MTPSGLCIEGHWVGVHDADPRAVALYRRHYSCKPTRRRGNFDFMAPGDDLVLLTVDCTALFGWYKGTYRLDGQQGVECSVFRNEGPLRSSDLILEAMDLAWRRWPGQRLFTYVWDAKVKSANPGYCFKMAGWDVSRDEHGEPKRNADGRLTILEVLPP